ncbi:PspC domain-containing protein [Microbacterium sp.]|uniref:PspC domain-containing protein n=1 Tax=Microbacterium sp. TaxID=51671 RepID=UPI00092CB824|nr:PspC domain-containing protein [Microbacterium sp.]MBN9184118.1 PspC domain-containing protein [Microbacterium sp.]MBN9189733.1 PspC domain-containing protein [Microbacterium sp.]MBN9193194.1 PspC domain-containing protein [Microbacterium sp.]OJU61688.1 MAG: DNA-binding protein [Microbacterium sp. 70-38]
MNELVRPLRGRWIAGVCLALSHRFGMSVSTVRALTIVAMVLLGLPLWAYVILWIVIPSER